MEDIPETPLVSHKTIIFKESIEQTQPQEEPQDEKKCDKNEHFHVHVEDDCDSEAGDLGSLDCTPDAVINYSMTFCAGLKNLLIMLMLIYFWCWTSANRETGIDVLNQMCRNNELNITFHSDSMQSVNTWNSKQSLKEVEHNLFIKAKMDRYENGAMGNMPTLVWQDTDACKEHYFKNGTLNNACLDLSEDIMGATRKLMNAEFGDKTFILISVFMMAWSSWHLKEHRHDEKIEHDHKEEETKQNDESVLKEGGVEESGVEVSGVEGDDEPKIDEYSKISDEKKYKGKFKRDHGIVVHESAAKLGEAGYFQSHTHTDQKIQVNPLQMFITATLGTILVNWKSLAFQTQIRVNEVGLFVSFSCVFILMYFLYGICNQHMQASNDSSAQRKKHEDAQQLLTKEGIIDEYNRQEKQKKDAKKFQREVVRTYKIGESLNKQEEEKEKLSFEIEQEKQRVKRQEKREAEYLKEMKKQGVETSSIEGSDLKKPLIQKEIQPIVKKPSILEIQTENLVDDKAKEIQTPSRKKVVKKEEEKYIPGTMTEQFDAIFKKKWDDIETKKLQIEQKEAHHKEKKEKHRLEQLEKDKKKKEQKKKSKR